MAHAPSSARRNGRRLAVALAISAGVFLIEIVAGVFTNSLALVADAGHVFVDTCGMALSLGAVWMATRPATGGRTYGLYRLEVVAAVVNAVLLFGVAAFVLWEGGHRLVAPQAIDAGPVVAVAIGALLANLGAIAALRRGRSESLNVRAAYIEVFGDLLGSMAVLVAASATALFAIRQADAAASLFIGLLMLPRTWGLLRDGLDVLLESSPHGVDMALVRQHVLDAPGVEGIHDLHAWTITSGMNVVSAHVVLGTDAKPGDVLDHLAMCLADDFDIEHSTFQLETADHVRWEAAHHDRPVLHA